RSATDSESDGIIRRFRKRKHRQQNQPKQARPKPSDPHRNPPLQPQERVQITSNRAFKSEPVHSVTDDTMTQFRAATNFQYAVTAPAQLQRRAATTAGAA